MFAITRMAQATCADVINWKSLILQTSEYFVLIREQIRMKHGISEKHQEPVYKFEEKKNRSEFRCFSWAPEIFLFKGLIFQINAIFTK